jgi:hypothetical protein
MRRLKFHKPKGARGIQTVELDFEVEHTKAINVDCASCDCHAVVNGRTIQAPPLAECACDCHSSYRFANRGAG